MSAQPAARLRHIPELLPIHADELAFLWGQRCAAMHDTRYTLQAFVDLNQRVEAHVQGLLAVPAASPAFLLPRLEQADERDDAFAAAHALMRLADPALAAHVARAFAAASGPALLGLRDALGFTALGTAAPAVQAVLAQGDAPHAVAAATVLAHHELLDAQHPRLTALLLDDDPAVCAQAWRVLTLIDARLAAARVALPPRPYKPALLRPDAPVRAAVLGAAFWSAQPWALPGTRQLAAEGDAQALQWLAAVGEPQDWPQIQAAAPALADVHHRAGLLARFGHPAALDALEAWMRDPDPTLAAAAGEAWARITGTDARGQRVIAPVAADADDFTREFAPSIWLPDLAKAAAHRQKHGAALSQGTRWNRGIHIGNVSSAAELAQVDLPARWDACARAALQGRSVAAPPPVL